jgi:predicted TIM-barrel fold metal-dependent hydrolase
MRNLTFILLTFLFGCQSPDSGQQETAAVPSQEEIEKIDFHAHYRYDRDFLVPLLAEWNMRALLVDVSKTDSTGVHRYWDQIHALEAQYPDRFFLCTGFDAFGIDEPGYADRIIAQLEEEIAAGAQMVKVWKNFGMVYKDAEGNYVQIDDPRLQPIWDYLIGQGIPVLAHIGEPIQAWRPLEEGNPHYGYYRNHPEYHAYQHPEIPSWETIIEARDNWLASNPQLTVVGAHNGSMSHDVDLIAQHLDRYPNFYVENAARFGDLVRQNSDKVRDYFIKYQDRILYGTDLGTGEPAPELSPEELENEKARIRNMINRQWEYLSSADSLYADSAGFFGVDTRGLGLPDTVLRKVYAENALEILEGKVEPGELAQ